MPKLSKHIFRLNVTQFLSETSRLGPTIVGAYLNIILDYFEQREAPPDDDSVLSRIVGCDISLWLDIRPKLEHLFEIVDKRWTHRHVEAEIAASAGRLEHSKRAQAASIKVRTGSNGNEQPDAYNEAAIAAVRKNKPTTLAEDVGAEDDTDDVLARAIGSMGEEDEDDEPGLPEPPIPTPPGINFESGLDPEFKPAPAILIEHMNDGYSSTQIADVLDAFKRYNINMGTTSNNWPEMWVRWWNRKKPPLHPAEKKPKPRVEVSRRAPAPPQTE